MKLEKLRAQLEKEKLAGLFVTDKINRRYLSGFTGSNGLLLVTTTDCHLFVDGRYLEQAQQQTSATIVEIPIGVSLEEVLATKLSTKTYGFEAQTISYLTLKQLKQVVAVNAGELIPTHHLIEKLRMIKTAEEIQAIQVAARIADQTLQEVLPMIKGGMRELDLANELDYRSKKQGSAGPAFETIVASGVRTSLPHAHASQKKIQKNELIMIDFGTIYNGYYSDITRTFAFGSVDPTIKRMYQAVLQAQKRAIAAIKLGETFGAIDQAARRYLQQRQLAAYFSHNLGHGIGLSCHEYPALAPNEGLKIQPNMTFTVEPGIYLPEKWGIRIEDDLLVDQQGNIQQLTNFEKEWMELDAYS